MAAFGLRRVVRVRALHIALVFVLLLFSRPPFFEPLTFLLIGMLTIWFGCSPLIGQLPRFKGDYSYGVYIYGFPVQQLAVTLWPKPGAYQLFAFAMLGIIPCAAASWHFVELPAQRTGKRFAHLWSTALLHEVSPLSLLRASRGVVLPIIATAIASVGLFMATTRLKQDRSFAARVAYRQLRAKLSSSL